MTMLAGGKWIDCSERNPEQYGKYRVLCVKRGQRTEDEYLWNGGYWVTPGGSPSKGVEAWWENPAETGAEEKKTLAAAGTGKALTLADYEARIHLYKEQIGTGYIGIGRTLLEAKEAKVVPHGRWESWVTETTGLTPRQAQRCMQAATEIRDGSAMARLEMSKALLLLSSGLDEEQREEIAEKAADEGATVKALREEVRQVKLKLVQETGAAVEIREALKSAEEERTQLEQQLKDREKAWNDRLNKGMADAMETGRNMGRNDAESEAKRREIGLRNELNKQRQYAESLKQELDRQKEAAVPADFAKDREILMEAAAEAEKRAADAEAELEALRAGGAGQPDPVWKVLKMAVERFMMDCEMIPLDPSKLISDRNRIVANVNWLGSWVDMMRKALDTAVPAEGAVE